MQAHTRTATEQQWHEAARRRMAHDATTIEVERKMRLRGASEERVTDWRRHRGSKRAWLTRELVRLEALLDAERAHDETWTRGRNGPRGRV